jgi:hypothetical protein
LCLQGLTFSIWGLIYVLLAIFIAYQFVAAFRRPERVGVLERVHILFFLSSIFNCGWIFAWHYEMIGLSVLIMLLLFVSLLLIYLRLETGKRPAPISERLFVFIPFSVYLGWITVATIANITAFLVSVGWDGFGAPEALWTVIVMAVGAVIAILTVFMRNDIFFALVVIWAYAGILIKRSAEPIQVQSVIMASIIGMSVIGLSIIIQLIRKRRLY